MKKILAIGGSNSKKSINTQMASYIASQVTDAEVTVLDWEEMVLPLYSVDLEAESGIPSNAMKFKEAISQADALVLSLAEYNGMITSALKNLWDWSSRIDQKIWQDKPMFLASTSPGGRGGIGALTGAKNIMPYFGGNVITDFSLPSFFDNFKEGVVSNTDKKEELEKKIQIFIDVI